MRDQVLSEEVYCRVDALTFRELQKALSRWRAKFKRIFHWQLSAQARRNRLRRVSMCRAQRLEILEPRWALTAEGSNHDVALTFDASGMGPGISATAVWGDGSQSALTVSSTAAPTVKFKFDYSLDTSQFFADATRRTLLEQAAATLASKLSDTLSAIEPTTTNTWRPFVLDALTGAKVFVSPTLKIAANEIYVYAVGKNLPAEQLGAGGAGGADAVSGTAAWLDTALYRGQAGAKLTTPTDFGPWGGLITFDTDSSWHFGSSTVGLESQEADFYSVALHELTHLLGFGVSRSWNALVSNGTFTGALAKSANGGVNVPLISSRDHFVDGLSYQGQETMMDPSITNGTRKLPTRLDLAALDDIGWNLTGYTALATGSHVYADDGTYPIQVNISSSTPGTRTVSVANAVVTNVPPTLNKPADVSLLAGQQLNVIDFGLFSDPGFGSSETFTYSINWGDGSPAVAGTAIIDQAGAAGKPTLGSFNANHLFDKVGTFSGSVSVQDDNGGTATQTFVVRVTQAPQLQLTLDKSSVAENAGTNAATLTIRTLNFTPTSNLTVSLSSSDTTEITLPASAIIAAGQTSTSVKLSAVDDALLDGTISVAINASASGLTSASIPILVSDFETLKLTVNRPSIREDAGNGAAVLTVTRSNTDRGKPLTVLLSSSDSTEATVPTQATILADAAAASVQIAAVDDRIVDGIQQVAFSAVAAGYVVETASIEVIDHEVLALVTNITELVEGDPDKSQLQFEITLPGPAPAQGVTLELVTSPPQQLNMPRTVTVVAGKSSITVNATLIDDTIVEGTKNLSITASSSGYVQNAIDLVMRDNDTSDYTNSDDVNDVDGVDGFTVLDILSVVNALRRFGTGAMTRIDAALVDYVDANGDGVLSPLDVLQLVNILRARR